MKRKTVWKILIGIMLIETLVSAGYMYIFYEQPVTAGEIEDILAEHPGTPEEFYAKLKKVDLFQKLGIDDVSEYAKREITSVKEYMYDVTQPYARDAIEWYPQDDPSAPGPSVKQIRYYCLIRSEKPGGNWGPQEEYLILLSEDKRVLGWTTNFKLSAAISRHNETKRAVRTETTDGE